MIQTLISKLKKGDIFSLRCDKEEPTLYVRDHYDRVTKTYAYHKYYDSNSEYFAKSTKRVYIS